MRNLLDLLRSRIAQSGPISLADYMETCLSNPEFGYYITRDPLGAAGDFTTSPEITQMFGEMLGLWVATVWQTQGAAGHFVLAELGPGRGTLMADILRAARIVPGFVEAADIWLVETSPVLRAAQAKLVPQAHWANTIEDLPEGPVFVVANEFFDALPIRQFIRDAGEWRERMVGLEGESLCFGLAPRAPMVLLDSRHPDAPDGMVVEISPLSEGIAHLLGERIRANGGAALIIDYGDWQGSGDTFQALAGHAYSDPLHVPGMADLTAHVGFRALADATGLAANFTHQGAFLECLGITQRAQQLARGAAVQSITAQHRRLTHPDEMGTLFKVLTLVPSGSPKPPGFE